MTDQARDPGRFRIALRLTVAALLAAAAAALARAGGAPWSAAAPFAAGAATFTAWRTVPGACVAFALTLAAALAALGSAPREIGALGGLLPALAGLEVLGSCTIVEVARVRQPRRVSRRLLGAWLASSGLVLLGLALCTHEGSWRAGSILLVGGVAYRLGVVPAYAWVPMLLRHPARRIAWLGAPAGVLSATVLDAAVGAVPDRPAAVAALLALALPTLPWALHQSRRQWRRDPPCARTYAIVAAMSAVVAACGAWWWLGR